MIIKLEEKQIIKIKTMDFNELIKFSYQYHYSLLKNKSDYKAFEFLARFHTLYIKFNDEKVFKMIMDLRATVVKENALDSFLFEVFKDFQIKSKESIISICYKEALTYQIQYIIGLAKNSEQQLIFIEFLDQILDLHYNQFDMYLSIPQSESDLSNYQNIFFHQMFYCIYIYLENVDHINIYKEYIIKLNNKYPKTKIL